MSLTEPARTEATARPDEAPPPILGRWRHLYLLVAVALAAWIALFTWLGWIYR